MGEVEDQLELHRKILSQKERKKTANHPTHKVILKAPASIFIYLTKLYENGPQRNNLPQINAIMRYFVTDWSPDKPSLL